MRAILLDLFGTVVHFAPQVPVVEVAGQRWRTTMGWLQEAAARELPAVAFEDLLTALMAVTEEITRQRPPEYFEVPSCERFRRALLRVGIEAEKAPALAERLSLVHMQFLASTTLLPAGYADALQQLGARYPLALVSNFDHAPTAHGILRKHDIAAHFDPILISADFGRRKPHPAIFQAALTRLGLEPGDTVHVGDSVADDVVGAHNAGIPAVWVNARNESPPPDAPSATVIGSLLELADRLRQRG